MNGSCVHHWLCDIPGDTVQATCKKCGAMRKFRPFQSQDEKVSKTIFNAWRKDEWPIWTVNHWG